MASAKSYVNGFEAGWEAACEWLAENYPDLTEGSDDYQSIINAAEERGRAMTQSLRSGVQEFFEPTPRAGDKQP